MDCEILGQAKQCDFSPAFNLSHHLPPTLHKYLGDGLKYPFGEGNEDLAGTEEQL